MRLLDRYNRVTLITTIIVMMITGIIYYQTISWILTNQIDKDLVVEENEIFDYVNLNHHLPQVFKSDDQQISFFSVPVNSVTRQFINTNYYNINEKGYESGRGLISAVMVKDKYYKILVVESKVETEDLIRIIFAITIGVILLLLVILLIINRLLLTRLWQPFYTITKDLKMFNVTDTNELQKVDTHIDEFKELNTAVISMASRVKHDYKDLKTFTENASHELLTPIAVINSKLDTLIQTDNFSERQSTILNDLYTSVNRLNRLNQSLLLLVKIENRLDHGREQIDLHALIMEMIVQFDEIFQDKKLKLNCSLGPKYIYASRYLVDILMNNLVSNAIRHNHIGGEINIELTEQSLTIANTGENTALPNDDIFKRFHKSSRSEGTGLGLTISRQICENFGFSLNYQFIEPYHSFTISFLKQD
ncbi:Signal transduction histidine kinase [Mucilaginibacter mallensis]|uniref:histidine kinase n=1 Tax=Mucilaginibacter mallensis TaxID=652787 RepID=A0A1H2BI40_MUCMA|nr:HAMP domain-containing sensor histidine kinase [Mucilaginibacter mallensis]SDT57848.1 Signal transduction histidine kinase [Mucilaginibacter mallensis]